MDTRELQKTVLHIKNKILCQNFDRRQLERYERTGDKMKVAAARERISTRQREIDSLRKTLATQRKACLWQQRTLITKQASLRATKGRSL